MKHQAYLNGQNLAHAVHSCPSLYVFYGGSSSKCKPKKQKLNLFYG